MGQVRVSVRRPVHAPPEQVYGYLADMREHHPRFLPRAFEGFRVEEGGTGAGTVTRFRVNAGGRSREYRMHVTEPEPGRVLEERDEGSSLVTRFTVSADPAGALVEITTSWDGAGGVGGFFERLFAPRAMSRIYTEELQLLDAYAREH